MTEHFKKYTRKGGAEARPYETGEDVAGVSISQEDAANGSPKLGDMIAHDPANHGDRWLINAVYFAKNFELAV